MSRRYLLGDQLGHHVAGVDVDGADGHDLLPVARRQLPQQHVDQGVQLGDLWGGEGTVNFKLRLNPSLTPTHDSMENVIVIWECFDP